MLMAAVLVLAACNERGTEEQTVFNVSIDPVITRATEVNFEEGDCIGLSIAKDNGESYAQNAKLSYDGSAFSGSLDWYSDGGESSSLKAYYPYSDAGFPSTFTVGSDQSSGAGKYDLMLASKSGVKPQAASVTMVFQHQLSQIVIDIDNVSGVPVESVVLKGLLPTVALSEDADGKIVAEAVESAEKIDIVTEATSAGTRYRAIIVPQTMAFGLSIKSSSGSSVIGKFAEVTMKPGYTYSIDAKVTAGGVSFSLAGEIQAWENGGTLEPEEGGDEPDEPGDDPVEDDEHIVYGGRSYKIVKLSNGQTWMAEPLAYLPAGKTPSSDPASGSIWYPYKSDGKEITVLDDKESIKANGYLYTYEEALATKLTDENYLKMEKTRGICPEGWHIPTRAEYFSLCGYSNKSEALGETSAQSDDTALFWNKDLNYASIADFNAAGWNFVQSGSVFNSKWNALICTSSNCKAEDSMGKAALTYLATSSANKITSGYYQMFCVMTTFTAAAYPQGRVSLAFSSHLSGVQVRCVKD